MKTPEFNHIQPTELEKSFNKATVGETEKFINEVVTDKALKAEVNEYSHDKQFIYLKLKVAKY